MNFAISNAFPGLFFLLFFFFFFFFWIQFCFPCSKTPAPFQGLYDPNSSLNTLYHLLIQQRKEMVSHAPLSAFYD
jgi:hypothetical protein